MEKLLEEYSEEFGHEHTTENLQIVEQTTNAIILLKGNQDLLEEFGKYYIAQFIKTGNLI